MVDKEDLYTNGAKDLIVSAENDSCGKGEPEGVLARWRRLGIKWQLNRQYWQLRKKIGAKIIGHPRYGEGILLQIPLGHMDEGQKKAFWEADRMLGHAGIGCDSGMGCGSGVLDLEWDWSLKGAYAKCKRCGFDTREQVKRYCKETREEHASKNCKTENCVCRNGPHMAREELGY
jgi:hypothetical protein